MIHTEFAAEGIGPHLERVGITLHGDISRSFNFPMHLATSDLIVYIRDGKLQVLQGDVKELAATILMEGTKE